MATKQIIYVQLLSNSQNGTTLAFYNVVTQPVSPNTWEINLSHRYTNTYICTTLTMYTKKHKHVFTVQCHIHIHTHTYKHKHKHVFSVTQHTHAHTHTHTHMHAQMHAHTHTHTHTHTAITHIQYTRAHYYTQLHTCTHTHTLHTVPTPDLGSYKLIQNLP